MMACEGHLLPRRVRKYIGDIPVYECPGCDEDHRNGRCPDYKPMGTYRVEDPDPPRAQSR